MTQVTEIAPDVYRISTYVSEINFQHNQFLIRDDEPLLFHTGLKRLFPVVRDAVATLIEPSKLRWIGFSHLEADECGALSEWQALAPDATAVCSYNPNSAGITRRKKCLSLVEWFPSKSRAKATAAIWLCPVALALGRG